MCTHPTAFASYSWDEDAHKTWVKDLATRLRTDGVDVRLEQWHSVPGNQLTHFMEIGLAKAGVRNAKRQMRSALRECKEEILEAHRWATSAAVRGDW